MKKIGLFLGLCSLLFIGGFSFANDYEYTNLDITANILIDGTINVKEDFTANFFVDKHGIIRTIPLNYSVGGKNFHIDVSDINVEGKKFTTSKSNGEWEIKIGDANKTIIGQQNYPISYTAYGLIRNFSGMGYSELYWNLVGYDFDTNINSIRVELILPKTYTGFTADDFLITTDGKAKTIYGFDGTVDWSQGNRIIITYDKGLSAYQGITLAIKFPNDYFEFDHDRQSKLSGRITNSNIITNSNVNKTKNLIGTIIILTIFGLIVLIPFSAFMITIVNMVKYIIRKGKLRSRRRKRRKIFEEQYPIIVQYNPPKGLNSAEVGLLLNRQAKTQDLLTIIYKWANEKRIQIDNIGNATTPEFSLTKLKELPQNYHEYERNLFDDIFDGIIPKTVFNVNKEANSLYHKLESSALDLKKFGLNRGWFYKHNSDDLPQISFKDGVILIIAIPILIILPFTITLILLAIVSVFIGTGNLQETEKGAELISHILGYKEFIRTCDEDKLRLFLKQDPTFFDKTLPYAIVFGLESELINKIAPIMQEMNIKSNRYDGNIEEISSLTSCISTVGDYHHTSSSNSSYDSDSGWDSGSSFSSGGSSFSSGGGGGGGGGRSW